MSTAPNHQDWLAAQATASPDALALVTLDVRWTYAELDAAADALCGRLASLGLPAGARLAMHMPSDAGAVALVHACARLGLALVPINTRLAPAEVAAQLKLAQPACLICDSAAVAAMARGSGATVVVRAELYALAPAPFSAPSFDLERDQAIVFTSGSSGLPKGVRLSFTNHLWSAVGSAARLGSLPSDNWLSVLPLFHVGGLAVLFRGSLFGFTVTLLPRFDPDEMTRAFASSAPPVTLASLVPTMLKRLLDADAAFPASLRCVLLGGAAADEALLARALARGVPIATTYGLTEAASQVATQTPAETARKPGSVGKPVPNTCVRIIDAAGNELPSGEIGEIAVRGPTVMRGYLDNPEATAQALVDGELRTGDLGYRDADGDLFVMQRRTDLIVSGGENVYPAEVERVLRAHPAVEQALVVGVPDAEWGQRVGALLVTREGETLDLDGLLRHAREQLAGYKLPRVVRAVNAFPLLPNGKHDRRAAAMQLASAA
jgi:o-succinylbenzoate---CoA ligase